MHITRQTLELLEDRYFFEPGTDKAKNDPMLIKNGIETFLISPQYYASDTHVSVFDGIFFFFLIKKLIEFPLCRCITAQMN